MFLPEKVKQIISILEQRGFEAYAVGGCVRDTLLERTPEDWDITTNASPKEVKALFRRTVDTGIAHGTVTVLLDQDSFEVTTYRIDGDYEDSRHPKEVTFTNSLKEDLKRRDFTINAMAYNEKNGLVDCFGGMKDLKVGVIRCVGNAEERFTEDALRILRCVRFSAQLGFSIEKETEAAAVRMADSLKKISAERIAAEWTKLLLAPHVDRIMTAYQYGILKQFFPEVTVTDRLVRAVELIPASDAAKQLRYAMLFCRLSADDRKDFALPAEKTESDAKDKDSTVSDRKTDGEKAAALAKNLLRRLKFDNETIRTVSGLVRYLHLQIEPESGAVRRAVYETGETLFPLLFPVWRAYTQAGFEDGEKLSHIDEIERLYGQIISHGDCLSLKELAVTGGDLIALGIAPGKEMGEILHRLLFLVLDEPSRNTREYLLEAAKNFVI